ncbi:MAG: cysteine desulfurase [Clostridiales bacterium]|nr:cysteine desulfurase [Clostridiales bacterium]
MSEIYFDNGATTKPTEQVVRIMTQVLTEDYGNPSSLHRKGQAAERYVIEARKTIADCLHVPETTIYFTSGATESSNTALLGAAARAGKRRRILAWPGEHPATGESLKRLAEEGFEVTYLPVDAHGKAVVEALEEAVDPDVVLVTCMHVNNETGVIQPIDQIGRIVHKAAPKAMFHVDAVQSFGKIPIDPVAWEIDLMSTSAHKIHGPKGIGFLYIARNQYIPSLLRGGGQEKNFRSGTENVPGICGFGQAVREAYEEMNGHAAHMQHLKELLYREVTQGIDGVTVNGPEIGESAPHILNLRIEGVRSEVLLHALEDHEIYVSSGSACASNKPEEKSPALSALGLTATAIDESLRISFCRYNTEEEVYTFVRTLQQFVPMLRRFRRK